MHAPNKHFYSCFCFLTFPALNEARDILMQVPIIIPSTHYANYHRKQEQKTSERRVDGFYEICSQVLVKNA